MQRSQLPAATAWHLGNWNTIWKNYFLDYTSSLKKTCYDIKAKVKLVAFVKWSLTEICWCFFGCFFFWPSPCWSHCLIQILGKIRISLWILRAISDHEWFLCFQSTLLSVICIFAVILNMDFKVKVDSKNSRLQVPLYFMCT